MTFRHPGASSVHELYTLIGSFRRHRLRFSRFSLSLFPRLSFYLSLPLRLRFGSTTHTERKLREYTYKTISLCADDTEEGYPPINRASQCTPSVVALQYTSRREITPRRWISVIINALPCPIVFSIHEICKSTVCVSAITFVFKNLETCVSQDLTSRE